MKYGFGIDVGGMSIKTGLLDIKGNLLEEAIIPSDIDSGSDKMIDDMAKLIAKLVEKHAISKADILGIGIGIPGPVNDEGVVNKCVNLNWGVVPLAHQLKTKTGYEVKVCNDANAAALGEYWLGSGKNYSSICLFTLGTGIGGGIIIDGKIINGAYGAGGEVGHISVPSDETRNCTCGKTNCLERFSSAKAVETAGDDTCANVFSKAQNGDKNAEKIIDLAVDKLAYAMGNIACVIDPACFVMGGGMSKAGDYLLDKIKAAYPKYAFHASKNTCIVKATLGNQAGIYGAFRLLDF